jgi:hypothetical protein
MQMETQAQITDAALKQCEVVREFLAAMQVHRTNLRLDINQMEAIVGCIAKSTDEEVVNYLPEANLAISNLRGCLSTFEAHRQMFEICQRSFADA